MKGNFKFQLPKDVAVTDCIFADAKIGLGLSDFKGIEEKPAIQFNNSQFELLPETGTPSDGDTVLISPIILDALNIGTNLNFEVNLKVRGSEYLHFLPYAANSSFTLQSEWASPSFDGNTIPNEKEVNAKGFTSKWLFSRANIPVGLVNKSLDLSNNKLAFGVTLLQPADQYAKTMRSVKYAILIIGLSFALFFIIELMQQKPFHPMQYVLVGIALTIFYTLLLSISEYILFSYAYLIAATATTTLICLYTKAHFKSWKTASVFAFVLSLLYGFIYVLISLENTALLVGSIGLFVVLALIMYSSRKINWYGNTAITNTN
jgi:inner membrane protein